MNQLANKIFEEIKGLTAANKRVNFIFIGDSVLHLASFNAFVLMMQDKGIQMCGVVCNSIDLSRRKSQFEAKDVFLPVEDFSYIQCFNYQKKSNLPSGILEKMISPVPITKKYRTSNKQTKFEELFYLIGTDQGLPDNFYWKIAFQKKMPVMCILLEEGTASYLNRDLTLEFFRLRNGLDHRSFLSSMKKNISRRIHDKTEAKIREYADVERFSLFENPRSAQLKIDPHFSHWFNISLKQTADNANVRNVFSDNEIVFTGTNFAEMKSDSIEFSILKTIISCVQNSGFNFTFRPHPRTKNIDKYKSLGIKIDLNQKIPFEALLANSDPKPKAIIGFSSTSQITASAIWGIPCFSITGLLEDEHSSESSRLSKIIEAFIKRSRVMEDRFCDYLIPINNKVELKEYLTRIKRECNSV